MHFHVLMLFLKDEFVVSKWATCKCCLKSFWTLCSTILPDSTLSVTLIVACFRRLDLRFLPDTILSLVFNLWMEKVSQVTGFGPEKVLPIMEKLLNKIKSKKRRYAKNENLLRKSTAVFPWNAGDFPFFLPLFFLHCRKISGKSLQG